MYEYQLHFFHAHMIINHTIVWDAPELELHVLCYHFMSLE